jgi:hypothetical protein
MGVTVSAVMNECKTRFFCDHFSFLLTVMSPTLKIHAPPGVDTVSTYEVGERGSEGG